MAKRRDQTEHDEMLKYIVIYLTENHYKFIKAELTGYEKPKKICWINSDECHTPDCTAILKDIFHIWEAETGDTITDDLTERQWKLFAAHASQFGSVFNIVIPDNLRNELNSRLDKLGITAIIHDIQI
jgi:hypothetical protein